MRLKTLDRFLLLRDKPENFRITCPRERRRSMETRIKRYGVVAGILAFLFCLAGGFWILVNNGFDPKDPLGAGLGLYFIGKALFVGPMLIIASLQLGRDRKT
jgi:hypothetical protein